MFHKKNAEKAVTRFKPLGFVFGLAIPVFAALVTFSMRHESGIPQQLAAVMGLALTLLTIVNSVLKPGERFTSAAHQCIAIHEWKQEFDIRVAETDTTDERAFRIMIREMDRKLSDIGKAMVENCLPQPSA